MPEFAPKDKLADFMEFFSIFQDIPLLTSAEMLPNPEYDQVSKRWTVQVRHGQMQMMLRPKHLVIATGALGKPNIPELPNRNIFKGIVYHSDEHKNADNWKGKRVIIVGPVRH